MGILKLKKDTSLPDDSSACGMYSSQDWKTLLRLRPGHARPGRRCPGQHRFLGKIKGTSSDIVLYLSVDVCWNYVRTARLGGVVFCILFFSFLFGEHLIFLLFQVHINLPLADHLQQSYMINDLYSKHIYPNLTCRVSCKITPELWIMCQIPNLAPIPQAKIG